MNPISGELAGKLRFRFEENGTPTPDRVEGIFHFPEAPEFSVVSLPSFVESRKIDAQAGRIQVILEAAEGGKDSLRIEVQEREYRIPVVSASVYYSIWKVLTADPDEALQTLSEIYSGSNWAWDFRDACRDVLCFDAYVRVLNTLAGASSDFEHTQFRSGESYFAKRVKDSIPQGIHSFSTLEKRVSKWNNAENLREISIDEVISEKLGRNWYRDGFENERNDLLDIDFEPTSYDPGWKSLAPASWIAHLVLSEGIDQAREFTDQRPVAGSKSYDDLKQSAKSVDSDKAPAWAKVVSRTTEVKNNDFRYDAFNYLFHAAKEYRGKGKFSPMIWAAAAELKPSHLPSYLHQEAKCNEQISIGHNWRRDSDSELAKEAFERAKYIARGLSEESHDFDVRWFVEAESSLIHETAKLESDPKTKAQIYTNGIKKLERLAQEYDVRDYVFDNNIEFLKSQRESING